MNQSRISRLRKMLDQVDPTGRSEGLEAALQSRTSPATEGAVLDVRRVNPAQIEAQMALESLDVLRRGGDVDSSQQFALEAIVLPYYRPVVDIVDNRMQVAHLTQKWQHLSGVELRPRIERSLLSIGRIDVPTLPSLPYAGTGFVVGENLLMTNRHVAAIFAQGIGTRTARLQAGHQANFDFYHENGKTTSQTLQVERVVMIHPYWDMALLKVTGLPADRQPLTLSTLDPATLVDRQVVVLGYPGYDPSGDEEFQRIQNRIFRSTYYVKRLQPGLLKVREVVESFEHNVAAITHDCSTLGGNSGSAVVDVQTGHVLGLHFAGQYLVANYAVSTMDLAQDSRVVDAGVKFEGRLEPRGDFYGPVWRTADLAEATAGETARPGPNVQSPPLAGQTVVLGDARHDGAVAGTATWTIPLQVTVTLEQPVLVAGPGAGPGAAAPREGLFGQPALPPSLGEFTAGSLAASRFEWPAALSLAWASKLSYADAAAVRSSALGPWGLQTCEFIESDDTQCFVASSADAVMVAFRGTESLGDWLGNLNAISTTRDYGTVHRGFLGAFQVVDDQLRSILAGFGTRPVLLTGHSLGGALATIAAAEWQGQIPIAWIYTYGQPAVGKGDFPAFMVHHYAGKFFRFVNDDDIVPRVPPTYRHVGRLFHFKANGQLEAPQAAAPTESAGAAFVDSESPADPPMLTEAEFDRLRAQLLEQRARARSAGVESLEAPAVEGLFPSVSDHAMDRYLARIAAQT